MTGREEAAPAADARLPSIDELLRSPAGTALIAAYGRALVTTALRDSTAAVRTRLAAGDARAATAGSPAALVEAAATALAELLAARLVPVLNLTGTVLHTNLGRAPLPPEALAAINAVAAGASNLEYDLARGRRGERDALVEDWICRLTGAAAATVVNNNAAAVLLVLNTLARGREVAVSRGELVEIGGSFRIPEVMARAGTRLVEVGTTNRTHARDYEEALAARSAALMKVHTSNYVVSGFTASVPEPELARIAHAAGLPLVVDLGSGTLVDLTRYGLPREQTVAETLAAGADLVTFSGDKLLGGPQCGIVAGRADLVARVRRNPMKRALRVDKLTLAALGAVLRLYGDPARLCERVPALRLLTRSQDDIRALAERLRAPFAAALGAHADVSVAPCLSQIGSGALPVEQLPSAALVLRPRRRSGRAPERLAAAFRALPLPVVGRVADGALLLDLRCLEDATALLEQLPHLALPETAR